MVGKRECIMISKTQQTKKNRKPNLKRLDLCELRAYKDTIFDECNGMCQLCLVNQADDFHHPFFGRQGADKDDTKLTAVCRNCHSECHALKHGGLNLRAKNVAMGNWSMHNG